METLINQVKLRVTQMYSTIIEYFKSDELYVKVFGLNNEELFIISREGIDSFEPEKGQLYVIVDVEAELIKDFCDAHLKEEPHFIARLEYWVNNKEGDILIHSLTLKKPAALLTDRAVSIKYVFTSNYVEEAK